MYFCIVKNIGLVYLFSILYLIFLVKADFYGNYAPLSQLEISQPKNCGDDCCNNECNKECTAPCCNITHSQNPQSLIYSSNFVSKVKNKVFKIVLQYSNNVSKIYDIKFNKFNIEFNFSNLFPEKGMTFYSLFCIWRC